MANPKIIVEMHEALLGMGNISMKGELREKEKSEMRTFENFLDSMLGLGNYTPLTGENGKPTLIVNHLEQSLKDYNEPQSTLIQEYIGLVKKVKANAEKICVR